MNSPMIRVERLSFSYYGGPRVLDDVSFEVSRGSFVLLAGPTGSGKSTLLRCLNGLIPHFHRGEYEGTVTVNGRVVARTSMAAIAAEVGLVFQNPENQLVALNVEREVAFGPENLGLPREEIRKRVESAIERVGIEHLRDAAPGQLSGGEQQRVAIASILAMKPSILLLDEPTSNLDPQIANSVVELLSDLKHRDGTTIVLSEHRLELILPHVDRVICLDGGRVAFDGSPAAFVDQPSVEDLDVELPPVVRAFKRLKKLGAFSGPTPLNHAQAVEALSTILRGRKGEGVS
ncbi:MAG: hypothetical protein Kow0069_10350 [Promethearchaeota archaeon]